MTNNFTEDFNAHIDFSYTCFDRVIIRGYITSLFCEGSVIRLLRNLGFKKHSDGVLKTFTDQFNSHIKKVSDTLGLPIHWWGNEEKEAYHSKVDFVKDKYRQQIGQKNTSSQVICIIKSVENTRTFANKEVTTKAGKKFTKMYSCNKFVSHYYIYIHDESLGLCYLKIASYLPFPCEFYMNGHNYLEQQFDIQGQGYKMMDNSFTQVDNLEMLKDLVDNFQPSIALGRIDYWMNVFFKFDKGERSTCSKLLAHNWYTSQTEISTNIIFKSAKFANSFFQRVLNKHHTIGLPDRLTEIFSLKKTVNNSKTTQNKYKVQACIKHWLEGNSIKCYNKGGCLLRIETTINKPDLPGLKLKKPACNLQAYYWYGFGCNSRYLDTLADIDISSISGGDFEKYQETVTNEKGAKIAAPDLRKRHQLELFSVLLSSNFFVIGFRNKDLKEVLEGNWKTAKIAYELRKLRVRGAIKKHKSSHYYRLTEEGFSWLFYSIYNYSYFINLSLSIECISRLKKCTDNPSNMERAYRQIKSSVSLIMSELGMVA
jgi:hypothetical protein